MSKLISDKYEQWKKEIMKKEKVFGSQFIIDIDQNDSALYACQESGKARNTLSHYTTAEVLKKIFTNKMLKFNRIDKVNDRLESELFGNDEISHLVYVSCFTHDDYESVPMWMIYGKKEQSVRLTFELCENDFAKHFIDDQENIISPTDDKIIPYEKKGHPNVDWYCTYTVKDILYDTKEIPENHIKYICQESPSTNKEMYNLTAMGSIKLEAWKYEQETRLITYLRTTADTQSVTIPDVDFLFVPINFNKLKSITVIFSPWMDSSTKADIKLFMAKMAKTELTGIDIKFKDSVLTGKTNLG